MKLIDTYKKVDKREVLDCRIKSIKELARHYGLLLNSYEVMLLSEAYTFNYNCIKIPGIPLEELPYVSVSHNELETTFFHNLGIRYHKENVDGNQQGWDYIKNLMDEDIPVLFKIDSRFLNDSKDAAPKQMKLNLYYLSTLLLVGYDEESGEALVVLTNSDEKEGVNKITIEEFQKYRHTICAPFSPEGLCYYLEKDCGISRISQDTLQKAILDSLRKITDTMLNQGVAYKANMGTFMGTDLRKGLCGMDKLRQDLQFMLDQYDSSNQECHRLTQLLIIFLRNNIMFGSHTAFRGEFGHCIHYCADRYGIEELYPVSDGFEKIARDWRSFFVQLSGIGHASGDMTERLRLLIGVWDDIIAEERKQFCKLQKILSSQ